MYEHDGVTATAGLKKAIYFVFVACLRRRERALLRSGDADDVRAPPHVWIRRRSLAVEAPHGRIHRAGALPRETETRPDRGVRQDRQQRAASPRARRTSVHRREAARARHLWAHHRVRVLQRRQRRETVTRGEVDGT